MPRLGKKKHSKYTWKEQMCVAANAHLQNIFSKTQNCVLWNSNIRMTTCFVLPLQ
jgi:hypothetical protein